MKRKEKGEPLTQEEMQMKETLRRVWTQHVMLQQDGFSDPPGIKLRAVEGIHGIDYLASGRFTYNTTPHQYLHCTTNRTHTQHHYTTLTITRTMHAMDRLFSLWNFKTKKKDKNQSIN